MDSEAWWGQVRCGRHGVDGCGWVGWVLVRNGRLGGEYVGAAGCGAVRLVVERQGARVAQWSERQFSKLEVEGSIPFSRSWQVRCGG